MADEIIVETNWVLDVALHQDEASGTLFEYARAGYAQLFLPSFCVAEAIKAVETKQSFWHSLATRLAETRAVVIRSTTLTPLTEPLEQAEFALAQIGDSAEREFWGTLEQITAVTRLVEPTSETVRLTAQFRDLFNVSPADSTVLATVAEVRRAGLCSRFMSRDAVFEGPGPGGWLEREGIEYYRSAAPVVGPIRQRLERERGG